MKVSGLSHGLVTIITMVLGAAITDYLKKYFPSLFAILENIGKKVSYIIYNNTNINVPPMYFVPIFVIFVLAFLWGVLYQLIRHGRKKG